MLKRGMYSGLVALTLGITPLLAQEPFTVPVWPNGAVEDNGLTVAEETTDDGSVLNARTAELFVYLPTAGEIPTGAVVICPGGGYARQSMRHEGVDFAQVLAEHGIAGIVLKYRLPNGHSAIPLSDAQEAMRIVRAHSDEWGIDPGKVGIAGFSAGGHLASTLGTHCDSTSRPDFMLLFYPVVTMGEYTHKGSRDNLLGELKADEEWIAYYSNELHVSADTPPALFLLSDDDGAVPPVNSLQMYLKMKEAGVPAALYVFPTGGHGWGCRSTFPYYDMWTTLLWRWLQERGILGGNSN
ncbi:MAG: alpha/beta hydrolase [Porphyromonadaceae bacterium]|nr:alpha/beta hydrolase [Porphyromonadaceae bacterium]